MKNYDFICPNRHVFEVTYHREFTRDDTWPCPDCGETSEWTPSINIGAFSAGLWHGGRVDGINSASSLREWEKEHVIYEPGLDQMADSNLKQRISRETEEIKEGVRHHVAQLAKIESQEQRDKYVTDHKQSA